MYKVPVFDVFELTNVPISIKYYEFKKNKKICVGTKTIRIGRVSGITVSAEMKSSFTLPKQ